MAPIRRYLRITKYSVLEVRIYLQKPSDVAWLLSSRDPVLERIIQAVRPKVLPKLREENENARKKGGKKKQGIKDVVTGDHFEVSIFLKESSTRHSLLTKQKVIREKAPLKSTSNKLTGWLNTRENPIHVDADGDVPVVLEEDDDAPVVLQDIPAADAEETLFVSSSDEETFTTQRPSRRRTRGAAAARKSSDVTGEEAEGAAEDDAMDEDQNDKKKLGLETSYAGFSIYGRILCLIVTRKGSATKESSGAAGGSSGTTTAAVGGSQMMEQWVSTQAAQENVLHEDDEG